MRRLRYSQIPYFLPLILALTVAGCAASTPKGAPVQSGGTLPQKLHASCADHGGIQSFAPYDQLAHGHVTSYVVLCKDQTFKAVR